MNERFNDREFEGWAKVGQRKTLMALMAGSEICSVRSCSESLCSRRSQSGRPYGSWRRTASGDTRATSVWIWILELILQYYDDSYLGDAGQCSTSSAVLTKLKFSSESVRDRGRATCRRAALYIVVETCISMFINCYTSTARPQNSKRRVDYSRRSGVRSGVVARKGK